MPLADMANHLLPPTAAYALDAQRGVFELAARQVSFVVVRACFDLVILEAAATTRAQTVSPARLGRRRQLAARARADGARARPTSLLLSPRRQNAQTPRRTWRRASRCASATSARASRPAARRATKATLSCSGTMASRSRATVQTGSRSAQVCAALRTLALPCVWAPLSKSSTHINSGFCAAGRIINTKKQARAARRRLLPACARPCCRTSALLPWRPLAPTQRRRRLAAQLCSSRCGPSLSATLAQRATPTTLSGSPLMRCCSNARRGYRGARRLGQVEQSACVMWCCAVCLYLCRARVLVSPCTQIVLFVEKTHLTPIHHRRKQL